jgi:hypothetical protein
MDFDHKFISLLLPPQPLHVAGTRRVPLRVICAVFSILETILRQRPSAGRGLAICRGSGKLFCVLGGANPA